MEDDLGRAFADALSRRDFEEISGLLDPEIDFRGLTPGRTWEADGSRAVTEEILPMWIEESDQIERVISVERDSVADRERVAYRFQGTNPDGAFVFEQQAYFTERDGRIDWMRVLCSGFRPR
ncbi:MAG TPA: nuclear transport factor 2 family protein [Solirubrobacteraceae bacterium]|nr:nuclear transport factor 2 family protein [Solirubrobacteraceae bacterium]